MNDPNDWMTSSTNLGGGQKPSQEAADQQSGDDRPETPAGGPPMPDLPGYDPAAGPDIAAAPPPTEPEPVPQSAPEPEAVAVTPVAPPPEPPRNNPPAGAGSGSGGHDRDELPRTERKSAGPLVWTLRAVLAVLLLVIAVFVDYHLPSSTVGEITGIEANPGATTNADGTPDANFRRIFVELPSGESWVLGNYDAPLYLKFDSEDVQAQASALARESGNRVLIRYYGYRLNFPTMFPNVLSLHQLEGQDSGWSIFNTALSAIVWGLLIYVIVWITLRVRRLGRRL